MASILRIKRSELSGNPAVLGAGELAYSALANNGSNGGDRLYIGTGTESGGNAVNHVVIGGKYFTDTIDAATATNTAGTLVKRNGSGAAYLDIIGSVTGNITGDITGDVTGNLTGNVTGNLTGNVTGNITSTGASSFTNATITGGAINGTAIGATTASTIRGTTITATTGFVGGLTGDVIGNVTGDVTGNVTGNLTGNADTATRLLNPRSLSLTGDATATLSNFDGSANISAAITLANSGVTANTYGSGTAIPVVTVNAKGLVTGVTTANIATNLGIAGDTGTDQVSLLTDTLTFEGGNGLQATVTNNKVTIGLTGSINLNDLTISTVQAGSITVSGTLEAGDTTTANISVNGNAVVTGNLTVQGTTTSINSTTVAIGDKNIELAKDSTSAILSDGAGLTINGPATAATFTYSALDNRWNMNKDLNVANVYGALVGNASTATTWATARNLSLTGDASATLLSVNGSANVSAALTLATVNADVGSFGDSVTVPNFTVNAKGLVTAAGSTAIPYASTSTKGLASFDSTQFSISSGAVTIAQIDGGSF